MIIWLEVLSLLIILISVLHNLISSDWKWVIGALALQYVGIFLYVLENLSFPMALVKLIAGWIGAAILSASLINLSNVTAIKINLADFREVKGKISFSAKLLRILTACLVGIVIYPGVGYLTRVFTGLNELQAAATLSLCSIGLLIVSFRPNLFFIIIGLLTFLGGFEILYAALEPSVLINGMLAGVTLGIAFIGSYLLFVHLSAQE